MSRSTLKTRLTLTSLERREVPARVTSLAEMPIYQPSPVIESPALVQIMTAESSQDVASPSPMVQQGVTNAVRTFGARNMFHDFELKGIDLTSDERETLKSLVERDRVQNTAEARELLKTLQSTGGADPFKSESFQKLVEIVQSQNK